MTTEAANKLSLRCSQGHRSEGTLTEALADTLGSRDLSFDTSEIT